MEHIVIITDYDNKEVFAEKFETEKEAKAYLTGYNDAALRSGVDWSAKLLKDIIE